MNRIPELLVPAGGMNQLKAAVACGVDAVYMGGSSFSARANARNFTDEELQEAIAYAHTYGVKAHIAVNTLLYDPELSRALEFAAKIYGYGADAMIVQDTGLAAAVHQCVPGLPLHLSTQGTVCDTAGVRAAEALGAERAILARELSADEIRKICREKGRMEIEIFVHGAICISLSGQCHMSGVIGGRSGNRGDCAQPCRMLYSIEKEGGGPCASGYMLSPADMCLLGHLPEIAEAGVDSIKIEGRMKSPEYVALVTSVYRKYLDLAAAGARLDRDEFAANIRSLRQIYSRGRFTDAYFRGHAYADMMSGKSPKNQGLPVGKMLSFNRKKRHAEVRLTDRLSIGDGVEIRGSSASAGNIVTYIRDKDGQMLKSAQSGQTVWIGDLRTEHGIPEAGAGVFRITDKELSRRAEQLCRKEPPSVPVYFELDAAEGEPMKLTASAKAGGSNVSVTVYSTERLGRAEKRGAEESALENRLGRTGGTPYTCAGTDVHIQGEPFVPASLLNDLRRKALEELTARRLRTMKPAEEEYLDTVRRADAYNAETQADSVPVENESETIYLYFYDNGNTRRRIEEYAGFITSAGPERGIVFCVPAFMGGKLLTGDAAVLEKLYDAGIPADVVLPPEAGRDGFDTAGLINELKKLYDRGLIRAVMTGNAGQILPAVRAGLPFDGDTQLNVMNKWSEQYWTETGALSAAVTDEPAAYRSYDFSGGKAAVTIYGRIPVMYTEHCPVGCHDYKMWHRADGSGKGDPCCDADHRYYYCRKDGWMLKDRRNAEFPIVPDSCTCRAVIYSHKKINLASEIRSLRNRGARLFRIGIFDEHPQDLPESILQLLRR